MPYYVNLGIGIAVSPARPIPPEMGTRLFCNRALWYLLISNPWVGHRLDMLVEKQASVKNIRIPTGEVCNPGGTENGSLPGDLGNRAELHCRV